MGLFGQKSGGLLPPVIKFLVMANVIVFFGESILAPMRIAGASLDNWFVAYFALWPLDFSIEALSSLSAAIFWPHQLISYQFMHGSFMHIFFNMFMLWMFGVELERSMGSSKFFTFYTLAGIGAGLMHILIMPLIIQFVPNSGGLGPAVGASGALMGVMVAFAMANPDRKLLIFPLFIPIPAKYFIMGYIVIDLIGGFSGSDGIAHFAHLGGALTGFLLMKGGLDSSLFRFGDKIFNKLNKNSANASRGSQSRDDYFSGKSNIFSNYGNSGQSEKSKSNIYNFNWFTGNKSDNAGDFTKPYSSESSTQSSSVNKSFKINGEEISQSKIDVILDKISSSGYQNLTEEEKQILNELSKKL